jgi:hypothetical protein
VPAGQDVGTTITNASCQSKNRESNARETRERIDSPRLDATFDILSELATQEQNLRVEGPARPNRQPNPRDQVAYYSDYDGQKSEHPVIMPYSGRGLLTETRTAFFCGTQRAV